MNSDLVFMLRLLCGVITQSGLPEEAQNTDWNKILEVSKRHNITNIIGYGVMSGKYNLPETIKTEFLKAVSGAIQFDTIQQNAIGEIFNRFEKKGIDYMPLKGTILKKMYPQSDMRIMSDADILIKKEDYEAAQKVMADLEYTFVGESDHEFNFKKEPFIRIELHKHLVPSYNEDLYAYYGDGWKLAKKCENTCRYELSNEDFYIYLFVHFAKHYRDAGVGIKHILDLWLYTKKVPELDLEYVSKQLASMNLGVFFNNICTMMECWFEDREYDELSKEITGFIVSSGVFGHLKNSASAATIRNLMDRDITKAGKNKYLNLIFPSFIYMKQIFPILEKVPALLPLMWIVRLVKGVLFKRENISHHVNKTNSVDDEYIKKYMEHMSAAGIDIYNGRKKS